MTYWNRHQTISQVFSSYKYHCCLPFGYTVVWQLVYPPTLHTFLIYDVKLYHIATGKVQATRARIHNLDNPHEVIYYVIYQLKTRMMNPIY